MKYKQLTPEQRYQIYAYIQNDWTQTRIALELCVNKATISRELRRNKSQRGYRPKKAIELAQGRRHGKSKVRISLATWEDIEASLRQQWSPEQISGRLRHEGKPTVSHTWIYQHISRDKAVGGSAENAMANTQTKAF